MDEIFEILDNCHLNNDKCEKTSTNIIEINCIQNLRKRLINYLRIYDAI